MDQPRTPSPVFHIDERAIGWITFDDPERSVNVLTEAVMRQLAAAVTEASAAAREGKVQAVVVTSGKPGAFIAGADLSAIEDIEDPKEAEVKIRLGQEVFMDVERLPVPTVAAIDGTCMGGGTELALACTHRVVSDSPRTRIGLPEVQLGILPAWGGTTRLPRLVGLQAALDMLLTGKTIDARKARRIGFAGKVLPAELFREKVGDFALTTPGLPKGASRRKRKLRTRLLDDSWPGRKVVLRAARKKVLASTGGHYPAPLRILDLLGEHLGGSVRSSMDAEARIAGELVASQVSKNLIHVYYMREDARKGRGLDPDAAPRRVDTLAVVGAGVMGGGIAQLAAYNGIRVRMKDIAHEAVASGLKHARDLFDKAVKRRKLSRREADQHMERIAGGLDYHGFAAADLVVEAVVERLDVKTSVLAEVEARVRPDCVLATNTSSLSVDAMAEALEQPDRFCGMHFFNPVHRMPLVEIVRGRASHPDTIVTVHALTVRLGKVPVVVNDGPGFLVNRILGPYLNEAGHLLGDGATVRQIDRAAKAFGMPMGPLRLIDEVGIDVSRHAGAALRDALGDRLEPAPALVALGDTDRLGRKGGRGFYTYERGREKEVDESVYADLAGALPAGDSATLTDEDIQRRLVVAMINEAARVLEEGIVARAADVDLGMIMGTGFPPFRGGLLRFADALHPRGVLERSKALQAAHGDRFEPPALLEELARTDRLFYQAFGDEGPDPSLGRGAAPPTA